jgi:hypothetical protein
MSPKPDHLEQEPAETTQHPDATPNVLAVVQQRIKDAEKKKTVARLQHEVKTMLRNRADLPEDIRDLLEQYMTGILTDEINRRTACTSEHIRAEVSRLMDLATRRLEQTEINGTHAQETALANTGPERTAKTSSVPPSEVRRQSGIYRRMRVEGTLYSFLYPSDKKKPLTADQRRRPEIGGFFLRGLSVWNDLLETVRIIIEEHMLNFIARDPVPSLQEVTDEILREAARVEKELGIFVEVPVTQDGAIDFSPTTLRETMPETPLARHIDQLVREAKASGEK